MKKKDLRIVYMGTPDFAVPTLERLISDGYNLVGVITMPDKPVGRHQSQLQASPVKECALRHGIPVLQPERLKDEEFLEALRQLRADLQIVVAFRMLPEVVWAMPRLGTFNLHAALLPQYRGAAPINWAIINGDTETGITTFFLDHQIDTGRVIQQEKVPIGPDDNVEDIHDRLMTLGAGLVAETVQNIINGNVTPIPQEQMHTDSPLRPAPKIFRETCQIQWNKHTMDTAHNFVRGLSPYPGAWTSLLSPDGKETVMKIYRTSKESKPNTGQDPEQVSPTLITDINGKPSLAVDMPGGMLHIQELQLAGKKRMNAEDFLRGTSLKGWQLI
ncbi:MAG: methionyl-tRNA formyltransferase [Bacteroides sp.]|nr:methionyl-tRNA formyltransferase [Bacteroides sp.]MCM1448606.1 methionyl-tRNA formyltransferase [Bacteroides sp.]